MKIVLGIKLYSMPEVADLLGVTPETARAYVKRGQMKARVIGGTQYVSEEGIKEFIFGVEKPKKRTRTEADKTPAETD